MSIERSRSSGKTWGRVDKGLAIAAAVLLPLTAHAQETTSPPVPMQITEVQESAFTQIVKVWRKYLSSTREITEPLAKPLHEGVPSSGNATQIASVVPSQGQGIVSLPKVKDATTYSMGEKRMQQTLEKLFNFTDEAFLDTDAALKNPKNPQGYIVSDYETQAIYEGSADMAYTLAQRYKERWEQGDPRGALRYGVYLAMASMLARADEEIGRKATFEGMNYYLRGGQIPQHSFLSRIAQIRRYQSPTDLPKWRDL